MTDGPGKSLSDEQMREQRLQRNLKIVVIVLGVMIVAALATIIGKIAIMASKPNPAVAVAGTAQPSPADAGGASGGGAFTLSLPSGARVVSTSISGNRLAVQHESPVGSVITVIDLDTGARVADIKLMPAVPAN